VVLAVSLALALIGLLTGIKGQLQIIEGSDSVPVVLGRVGEVL